MVQEKNGSYSSTEVKRAPETPDAPQRNERLLQTTLQDGVVRRPQDPSERNVAPVAYGGVGGIAPEAGSRQSARHSAPPHEGPHHSAAETRRMQEALHELSDDKHRYNTSPVDGIRGPKTEADLAAFKKDNHLENASDAKVWTALQKQVAEKAVAAKGPEPKKDLQDRGNGATPAAKQYGFNADLSTKAAPAAPAAATSGQQQQLPPGVYERLTADTGHGSVLRRVGDYPGANAPQPPAGQDIRPRTSNAPSEIKATNLSGHFASAASPATSWNAIAADLQARLDAVTPKSASQQDRPSLVVNRGSGPAGMG